MGAASTSVRDLSLRGGLLCQGACALGQAGQQGLVGHLFRPGIGRVQHVVAVLRTEFRERLLQFLVAIAVRLVQFDTGKAKVTQGIIDDLLLGNIESLVLLAIRNLPVGAVEPLVLPHLGTVLAEYRQAGIVGLAQCLAVDHRIHVADR